VDKLRILVAEDDKLNRMMLGKLLDKFGAVCTMAEDGAVAVKLAMENVYDIVFLDNNMPGYTGPECAAIIRESYAKRNIKKPITVGISADEYDIKEDIFDEFMPKPFGIDHIQLILTKALKGDAISTYDIGKVAATIGLDEDTMIMLLDEFLDVMDEEVVNLDKAVASGNAEQITHVAHKMKGASANMMVIKLSGLCNDLQKADKSNSAEVLALLADIKKEYASFRSKFK